MRWTEVKALSEQTFKDNCVQDKVKVGLHRAERKLFLKQNVSVVCLLKCIDSVRRNAWATANILPRHLAPLLHGGEGVKYIESINML